METWTPRQKRNAELWQWFSAKKEPTDSQQTKLSQIYAFAREMAATLCEASPQSADQTVALRKLREAVMMCEEAILREPLPPHMEVHPASLDAEIHGKAPDKDGVRLKL